MERQLQEQNNEGFYNTLTGANKTWLEMFAGPSDYFVACETKMFDDLNRYDGDYFARPGAQQRSQNLMEENKKKLFEMVKEMIS